MDKQIFSSLLSAWLIFIIFFAVFLSVGITYSEKGCNTNKGNCDYIEIKGIITNYTYIKDTCKRCTASFCLSISFAARIQHILSLLYVAKAYPSKQP